MVFQECAGIPEGFASLCPHRDPDDPQHPKAAENLNSCKMFLSSKCFYSPNPAATETLGFAFLPYPLDLLFFSLCHRTPQERKQFPYSYEKE